MIRVLTIPNWSFGRSRDLLVAFEDVLRPFELHDLESDVDHNRTVSAFSGPIDDVLDALIQLGRLAFDSIDLSRHTGVHPRIGALDVCPFVPYRSADLPETIARVERFAQKMAEEFGIPIFLYEKSELGRHNASLPELRKGGYGKLLEMEIHPDFGPNRIHPRLGATVMGVRGFLIAMNVNLATENLEVAKRIAWEIRKKRREGEEGFLGVRALGLSLASKGQTQVSMNLTLPELSPVDPIIEWVRRRAYELDVAPAESELIGVIPEACVPTASRLPIRPAQIIRGMDAI